MEKKKEVLKIVAFEASGGYLHYLTETAPQAGSTSFVIGEIEVNYELPELAFIKQCHLEGLEATKAAFIKESVVRLKNIDEQIESLRALEAPSQDSLASVE